MMTMTSIYCSICGPDGTWQGIPPTCHPITCGPPPQVENAVVELLLKQPNANVNFEDNNKSTALHWACYVDNRWAVAQLLATPTLACFNSLNQEGDTPLMVAVGSGSMTCVRRLVECEEVDLDGEVWVWRREPGKWAFQSFWYFSKR